jgi:hypothetical protein
MRYWRSLRREVRARWQISDFQQTMDYCQLMDLGFVGAPFTWCNNREGDDYVKERLDRATTNADWWDLFPVRRVEILATQCSDHAPIQILFSRSAKDGRRRHMRFRYETGWQKNKQVAEIITRVWKVKNQTNNAWSEIGHKIVKKTKEPYRGGKELPKKQQLASLEKKKKPVSSNVFRKKEVQRLWERYGASVRMLTIFWNWRR